MFDMLRLRVAHGNQAIRNIPDARPPEGFRGVPQISKDVECSRCRECVDICPTGAVRLDPVSGGHLSIDLGACIFCGDCARACPSGAISFTGETFLAARRREDLRIGQGMSVEEYRARAMAEGDKLRALVFRKFRRSFKLRQVSAGGCNGCELELNAGGNVNFDMGRFGIDFVASPRHADGIVITGPITKNMASALADTYASIPTPKVVIAFGACAISGGVFSRSSELDRGFLSDVPVDLYVPGCPPHPLVFIQALLTVLGKARNHSIRST